MSEPIGFIGLGLLGLPVANNLVDAGYTLQVYNRTPSKADPLVARGVQRMERAVDTVTPRGVVVTILWDDAALEEVVGKDGFLERLGPGGVHISMSTVSPDTARRVAARHAQASCSYVEAPIFGRPEAAVAKKLLLALAGPREAKDRVLPILEAMGGTGIFDFGEAVGAGTTVKLAGNFLLVSAARSMSEALSMAEQNGVDPMAVVNMLTTTLFNCPIYQTYGKMIAEKKVQLSQSPIPLKDVGLFKRTAERVHSPTPISDRLLDLMKAEQRE